MSYEHELTVLNPATEEVVATVPAAGAADVDTAVARAAKAQARWAALAPADRARLLRRFADVVDAHVEELALLEVREAGHLLGNARWEAGNVRDLLAYAAGGVERLNGRQIPVPGGLDVTILEPLGVVGVIAPWNFPMPIAAWGTAPALAAGNAVILKPAETTPLTALRLAELALEAGLPEGLFQVLPGHGPVAGTALVEHPGVAKIVFTGSTRTGRDVMERCARQVKPVTLELGGKSPNIVFADADLARAVDPFSFLDNSGQDCCARTRILVQETVYDEVRELLADAVASVVVGDPADEKTQMGPLISRQQLDRVRQLVPADAPGLRGGAPDGPGFWFAPTVLTGEAPDSEAAREEIFGPVAVLLPFTDEEDAIRLANDTPYGLSGSLWTRDIGRALRLSRAVKAGNLSVNSHSSVRYWTPFGGYKQSGLGRELGPDALTAFTETKNVFISTEGPAQ
ncbi:acyl-CoA reductase-like NAD-dependent aldehyde dehydrogenase [Streptomyces sp. SAI-208]|uniref:aldehyde dehydrogenase family protein n=1 Tax=unclassified Streptomyces TaxID=2593676 RepID=UPI0024748E1F|nr:MULTISPECIES: aldehyde dehydrogenase family protein [unclassified Streptomyces]MDH6520301.1 acyl-CoA reductase-like NAD-dependent aldehyde dehydrogenase [Streptomyces sp. SAI-090]MDH6571605.1 acyl-CoA reductase-like NAD-dependent aldehyde dehydrogenase [Streptomyces sp. SAI-117]MDH6611280.1 acyl-CoA reductase-like NAD-dependent aldehyde dehydrogenase [Streptomyces sp. SAI-208]MDH6615609.1 acyl-CoA reductase-like NAD-dependent aldehyde dehydrogenase [Streptomyces sp. SAI-135]